MNEIKNQIQNNIKLLQEILGKLQDVNFQKGTVLNSNIQEDLTEIKTYLTNTTNSIYQLNDWTDYLKQDLK